jgi:hypothetical protein
MGLQGGKKGEEGGEGGGTCACGWRGAGRVRQREGGKWGSREGGRKGEGLTSMAGEEKTGRWLRLGKMAVCGMTCKRGLSRSWGREGGGGGGGGGGREVRREGKKF